MPNPNYTEARKHLKTYIAMLKEAEKGSTMEGQYDAFLDSMEKLANHTTDLYASDYGQTEKPLSDKDLQDTLSLYLKCQEECQKLADLQPKTKLDFVRRNISEYVGEIIGRDITALSEALPGKTISEIITKGRIYIDNQEFTKVSGQMSARIPITIKEDDGTERKGFFTESTDVSYTKEYHELLKNMRIKYPAYAKILDVMDKVENLDNALNNVVITVDAYRNFLKPTLKEFGVSEELFESFSPDREDYSSFFIDLLDGLQAPANSRNLYADPKSWVGAKEGANIDKRNSAMSSIADLLGVPNLIAHSENMTLSVNGKKVTGTFMENAVGKEAYNLDKDDPMRKYGTEVYETPHVIKQLADMQVLDYICGNIDRHEGNFFIQFDTSDPEHPKAKSIMGIDNDMSFFGRTGEGERKVGNVFIKPEDMTIVSKSMADTIMHLDGGLVRTSLAGFGLSSKEMDAAVGRLSILKAAITKDLEFYKDKEPGYFEKGRIRIVPDEEFEGLKFEQLFRFKDGVNRFGSPIYTSAENQFAVFSKMAEKIRQHDWEKSDSARTRKAFEEGTKYHSSEQKKEAPKKSGPTVGSSQIRLADAKSKFESRLPILKEAYSKLDKSDRWFISSSQNFKDMKQSLKDLITQTENMPKDFSFKDYKKLRDMTLKLSKDAEKYQEGKVKEGELSDRAKKRVDAAKGISGDLEDFLGVISTIDKNYETQVNAIVAMTLFNEGYPASTAIEMQPYNSELTDRARDILYESMADPQCTKLKDLIEEFKPAFATYSHTPEYQKELDVISPATKDALSKLIEDENELISSVEKNELGVVKETVKEVKPKEVISADKLTEEAKKEKPEDKKKRDLTVPASAKKKEDEKEEASIGVDGPK